eukprot:8704498-Pyramimonas_sp.AAC.1
MEAVTRAAFAREARCAGGCVADARPAFRNGPVWVRVASIARSCSRFGLRGLLGEGLKRRRRRRLADLGNWPGRGRCPFLPADDASQWLPTCGSDTSETYRQ